MYYISHITIKYIVSQSPYKNRTQTIHESSLACVHFLHFFVKKLLILVQISNSRYTSALPRATSPEKNQLTGKGSYHHSQVQTRDSVSTRLDEAVTPMQNNGRRDYDRYDQQRRSHDRQDQRRDRYDHSNDRNDPRRDRYDRY